MAKPALPKGTRDFLPAEVNRRNYIFGVIEKVFRKYGFLPIETPAMEALDTLLGKYGDEGDKLLFKVLNNGDYLKDANDEAINQRIPMPWLGPFPSEDCAMTLRCPLPDLW